MFYGTHTINLDEKGRVIIPAKYRADLEQGIFVTYGLDRCIWVLPQAKWDDVKSRAQTIQLPKDFKRLLFGGEQGKLDNQGRLTLPPELRRYAKLLTTDADGAEGLVDTVIVTGADEHLEVWQPERWRQLTEIAGEGGDEYQDHLTKLGL